MIPNALRNTDIFLLDQIMKDRYPQGAKILDAGCGHGRNLHWFYQQGYDINGIDISENAIEYCKTTFSKQAANFSVSDLKTIPFKEDTFDHVICNAVLHFADNKTHFHQMFSELIRVLKPNGSLFIRTTSLIGLKKYIRIREDIYETPDGSTWLLISESFIEELLQTYHISKLNPIKTTVVENLRCMTTLVLQKNAFRKF